MAIFRRDYLYGYIETADYPYILVYNNIIVYHSMMSNGKIVGYNVAKI